jgi:hypothetical protein
MRGYCGRVGRLCTGLIDSSILLCAIVKFTFLQFVGHCALRLRLHTSADSYFLFTAEINLPKLRLLF